MDSLRRPQRNKYSKLLAEVALSIQQERASEKTRHFLKLTLYRCTLMLFSEMLLADERQLKELRNKSAQEGERAIFRKHSVPHSPVILPRRKARKKRRQEEPRFLQGLQNHPALMGTGFPQGS